MPRRMLLPVSVLLLLAATAKEQPSSSRATQRTTLTRTARSTASAPLMYLHRRRR
jgi:hypothetical protein